MHRAGDGTIKTWSVGDDACDGGDPITGDIRCVSTWSEHTQAVWTAAVDDTGDALASASLDGCVKIWDVAVGKCRLTLRSHTGTHARVDGD